MQMKSKWIQENAKTNQRKTGELYFQTVGFTARKIIKDKEEHYIMIKEEIMIKKT